MGSLLRDLSCFMLQQVSAVSQFPVQSTRMIMQQATKHTGGRVSPLNSVAEGVLSFTIRKRFDKMDL